ncbi:MAG: sialidase family protein, partial [Bryobacteraceae bacterium]|nr:sialidase family protein [Bryobacteraceae bacterium]
GDPAKSTRGWDEPTLAVLRDGRILAILRGSNDKRPQLPAHKWACWSSDGGRSWTTPQPWTFDDLLPHPNGRNSFMLGNSQRAELLPRPPPLPVRHRRPTPQAPPDIRRVRRGARGSRGIVEAPK